MTKHSSIKSNNMWYIDSYILRYISQNQKLFLFF